MEGVIPTVGYEFYPFVVRYKDKIIKSYNSKEIKCRYLRNGQATIKDLRNVIILMLSPSNR